MRLAWNKMRIRIEGNVGRIRIHCKEIGKIFGTLLFLKIEKIEFEAEIRTGKLYLLF